MGNEGGQFDASTRRRTVDVLRHLLGAVAALTLVIGGVIAFEYSTQEDVPMNPHRPFTYPVFTEPLTTTPPPETGPAPPS